MRVITKRKIREFGKLHPAAVDPLERWLRVVRNAKPANPVELKRIFGTADFVGGLTVFDIGGNKYRLIAFVHYSNEIVYLKHLLTHRQYDQRDWK